MALKTIHVSDVPNLDNVPETSAFVLHSSWFADAIQAPAKTPKKFQVIGHRGSGMNMLQSAIMENTLLSFNNAAKFHVDFVEFDVQVTKDNHPIIFHDNFILTEYEHGSTSISEKRVTDLTLAEFFSYGTQRDLSKVGKPLLRRAKDGRVYDWKVEEEEPSCTLQEAFEKVDTSLGFNIELKFDDYILYEEKNLVHVLQVILDVVLVHAKERPIIFSTFQPDAARIMRRLQRIYPVFFLTDGGSELYPDVRRNSLDEGIKLCLENDLQGIVSEVGALFKNPGAITRIKESNLSLMTYGELNNFREAVYVQHLLGVDGVIVDLVQEITKAVSDLTNSVKEDANENRGEREGEMFLPRLEFS